MPKYCSENERVKRDYAFFLETASGKQDATIDAALRAIDRFETSTGHRPFAKFHIEQARSFRAGLVDQTGPTGRPLSAATITTTLKHLRNFFLWLSREPGFRSKLNANDANYFTPSEQDRRIAGARREGPVPTLNEIDRVLDGMPSEGPVKRRNRAVIAFTLLTGRPRWRAGVFPLEARQPVRRDCLSGWTRGEDQATKDLHLALFSSWSQTSQHRVGVRRHAHRRPRLCAG